MAQTPQEFFSKNCKWFLLVFFALFIFKTMQSCNRNIKLNNTSGEYIHTIDSLENYIEKSEKIYNDSIKTLSFELKMQQARANSADERADAVKEAVEKIKSNTTITVKGAEEIKDKK